jgi:tripartite ATP-independent transporter DctM subunit
VTPGEWLACAMFASFMALLFTGFPVAWVLGGLAVAFTALALVLERALGVPVGLDWAYSTLVVERAFDLMNNWVLVALPLFVFMGLMLDRSGLAAELMTEFSRFFGRLRGGLAITVVVIGVLLAATTGIIGAAVVLLAVLGLPPMLAARYRPDLATGTVCAVGSLGILIPPSIMLVMMADRLAMSVGDLFLGAVFPGLLLAALYVAYLLLTAWRAPAAVPVPDDAQAPDLTVALGILRAIVPAAALILAVLGSIFLGLATPTEAAGVGAFGALLLALLKGRLDGAGLREVGRETTRTTGFIFALLLGATAFSLVLRGLGGDALVARTLLGLPFGPDGVLLTILLAVFVLGFFLDWIEITLIVLPLVAPVVTDLGFDLVWFTVLFAVCLQTSFLTPPVGLAIFYLKGVAPPGISVATLYRGVLPFVALQLLGLALLWAWPPLVTWLPARAYGS